MDLGADGLFVNDNDPGQRFNRCYSMDEWPMAEFLCGILLPSSSGCLLEYVRDKRFGYSSCRRDIQQSVFQGFWPRIPTFGIGRQDGNKIVF